MSGLVSWIFGLLLRLFFGLIFYGTPLIGFWLASSLAAYLGGAQWIACTVGLLMFPIIPGAWEFHAWAHRQSDKKPWFTPLDRVSLRTFAVGLLFISVMLYAYPQTAFVALSTRGDWMLDGVKDPGAGNVRRLLFLASGSLEWLYKASKTNPYKKEIDEQARKRTEEATKQLEQEIAQQNQEDSSRQNENQTDQKDAGNTDQDIATDSQNGGEGNENKDETAEQSQTKESQSDKPAKSEPKWPWKGATLHPVVTGMPASVETSIKSVGRYIAQHEHNQTLRIKALHDYVADRVAYDYVSFYSGQYPDQSAQATFKTRKSVCAGYANLLSALAAAAGEKIIVVTGDARDPSTGDKLSGSGHAWNAARIGKRWYLVDACWDSGYVSREKGFTKRYQLDYLMPPPEVMIQDHFPDSNGWQLLAKPLSQGDFLRQPMLTPGFQAADLTLIAPRRASNDANSEAMVIVKNPHHQWLMAGLEQNGNDVGSSTDATDKETAQLICPLPAKGTYRLNIFVNEHDQYGQYESVGSVDFVNR